MIQDFFCLNEINSALKDEEAGIAQFIIDNFETYIYLDFIIDFKQKISSLKKKKIFNFKETVLPLDFGDFTLNTRFNIYNLDTYY